MARGIAALHDAHSTLLPTGITLRAAARRMSRLREVTMAKLARVLGLLCGTALASSGAQAADVTYERLLNPEPQNWLMNHRS